MTTDLEREAREKSKYVAKRAFESGLITADMEQINVSEHCFYFGFIAAATLREKELSELRAKLEAVPKKALRKVYDFAAEYAPESGSRISEDEFDVVDAGSPR